jgi:hypothetical protein
MAQKKSFPLRINEEIWEAVRRWSDEELRSVFDLMLFVFG